MVMSRDGRAKHRVTGRQDSDRAWVVCGCVVLVSGWRGFGGRRCFRGVGGDGDVLREAGDVLERE